MLNCFFKESSSPRRPRSESPKYVTKYLNNHHDIVDLSIGQHDPIIPMNEKKIN